MIIAISGTPGTGKTAISKELARKLCYKLIEVNKFAKEKKLIIGYDKKRRCSIVDVEKLKEEISKLKGNFIIEGHLSHFCAADKIFVLKTEISELKKRLEKREWDSKKIRENIEAEIFDVILEESLKISEDVNVIDTTDKTIKQVVGIVLKMLKSK